MLDLGDPFIAVLGTLVAAALVALGWWAINEGIPDYVAYMKRLRAHRRPVAGECRAYWCHETDLDARGYCSPRCAVDGAYESAGF